MTKIRLLFHCVLTTRRRLRVHDKTSLACSRQAVACVLTTSRRLRAHDRPSLACSRQTLRAYDNLSLACLRQAVACVFTTSRRLRAHDRPWLACLRQVVAYVFATGCCLPLIYIVKSIQVQSKQGFSQTQRHAHNAKPDRCLILKLIVIGSGDQIPASRLHHGHSSLEGCCSV